MVVQGLKFLREHLCFTHLYIHSEKNLYQKYEFVLHPRTKGWVALCSSLRADLASVYDVTVAYDTPAQTEVDLLRNNMPSHVYFHFKRYVPGK